uniref:Uncharacterized protein n=1 Tax=Opuntia streptacantha TaxID=393608 RepID=A0A7C9EWZ6_OPUST
MTSSHHSIHFTSLNCSYTSSSSDISPSSLTKGSAFWALCDLVFSIWLAGLRKFDFTPLPLPRFFGGFWKLSAVFKDLTLRTLGLDFFPATAATSISRSADARSFRLGARGRKVSCV